MLIKVIDTWCDLKSIPKSSFHVRAKLVDSIIGPNDTAETKGLEDEDGDTAFFVPRLRCMFRRCTGQTHRRFSISLCCNVFAIGHPTVPCAKACDLICKSRLLLLAAALSMAENRRLNRG